MSLLLLPAGQSLKTVALRLGVPIAELQKHAGITDPELVLVKTREIEVPNGFLRSQALSQHLKDAVVSEGPRRVGMNMWLALDIEQKRTRAGGGMHAQKAQDNELDALNEARRTYLRFEADSNELAIELFGSITATFSVAVRAHAFAGQSCALAQRVCLFGEPSGRVRPHALSAAKAALLADPKLPDARLAMALALGCDGEAPSLAEARVELELAVSQDLGAGICYAELAKVCAKLNDLKAADEAADKAIKLNPDWIFALESAAGLALRHGDKERALLFLRRITAEIPTYINGQINLAAVLKHFGDFAAAQNIYTEALAAVTKERHRQHLIKVYSAEHLIF